MIKIKFEDLLINALIVLNDNYNIKSVTSIQLNTYKKLLLKTIHVSDEVIYIEEEKPDIIKDKYYKYIDTYKYIDIYKYKVKDIYKLKDIYNKNNILYKYNTKEVIESLIKDIDNNKIYKKYNKLIRDKYINDYDNIDISILDNDLYKKELYNKLERKYNKFMLSGSSNDATDLVEILTTIVNINNDDNLLKKVEDKNNDLGKFDKRIFLEGIYINVD